MTAEGTKIDGKYLHVTGTTWIDNDVIASGMIKAGAISADKLSVNSLSAVSANIGNVRGGTITGSEIIGSVFRNANNSFRIDENGNISGAKITGSSLELTSSSLKAAGMHIRAVSFLRGKIASGGRIPLPEGYTEEECIWWATCEDHSFASIKGRVVTFSTIKIEEHELNIAYPTPQGSYDVKHRYYIPRWEDGGSGEYYVIGVKKI